MNCYPLPPSYTYKHSHSYSGYGSFSSDKSIHQSDKSSTKSKSRWSRKSSKQDFDKGTMRNSKDERSYSTFSSAAPSMKSRNSSVCTNSDAGSSRKPSLSLTKSNKSNKSDKSSESKKSSRSWIKRVFVGEVDEEEDPEAKRRERNAMWKNMSMGYEVSLQSSQHRNSLSTTTRIQSDCLSDTKNQELPVALPMFV